MNVADVLERTADLLDQCGKFDRGMICGRLNGVSINGEICTLIAMQIVTPKNGDASRILREFIGGHLICGWSDTSDHATVTSTLRACAAVERARAAVAETVAA